MTRGIGIGAPEPLGVTCVAEGVNVAVYSAHASAIELCLFDATGAVEERRIVLPGRTGDAHHAFVPGIAPGQRYGLRASGPYAPREGHRFNPAKLLIDPCATALDRHLALHPTMFGEDPRSGVRNDDDSAPHMPKAIVMASAEPGAAPRPRTPWPRTIVYEAHVRGMTMAAPDVPVALRGTCAGFAHASTVAHLVRLGVTTVELMPVAASSDEWHLLPLRLTNYWGYNPAAFMAPDPRLAPGGMRELRALVDALHGAGIEVLLDIVLNHTSEGDARGPTLSLRGLDNATYYRLRTGDAAAYVDDTGCGNTVALDRPPVLRLAMDTLRHYALAAGVDGFRFDLATTLGRGKDGFDPHAPLLAAIAQDPVLRDLKLVAEPWDVGPHGYQLGAFPAGWGEWNDRCRDGLRRFWRGDPGMTGELATRLAGSPDVFAGRARPPSRSVNFVAAHDGFTLADLVAYGHKHNEPNGEHNRDGTDHNLSWNHGVEGPTADRAIVAARQQDVRNLLATLFVARGTPMLAMGDELGRSQGGNNNAYAQDTAQTWLDWARSDASLLAFTAALAALRQRHPALRADQWLTGEPVDGSGMPDVEWRHPDGRSMTRDDWEHPHGSALVVALYVPAAAGTPADRVAIAFNAGAVAIDVVWPEPRDGMRWRRAVDTAFPGAPPDASSPEPGAGAAARSVVVLVEADDDLPVRSSAGIAPQALAQLAHAAGITTEWHDALGTRYEATPDTQRALLRALELDAGTTAQARARLAQLAEARTGRRLPAVRVVGAHGESAIPLAGDRRRSPRHGMLQLAGVDGATLLRLPYRTDEAKVDAIRGVDARTYTRQWITLPPLPAGDYTLVDEAAPDVACRLVVTPAGCHLPRALTAPGRRFGLAAHLYALRRAGDQGVGDFTTLADAALATAAAGGVIVGLNPLHALFGGERERASPYHPSDRRFLDPLYIDVERVPDFAVSPEAQRLFAQHAGALAQLRALASVDYHGTWQVKRALLFACFTAFEKRAEGDPVRARFDDFVRNGGEALRTFATFEAIASAHAHVRWTEWPVALRTPDGGGIATFRDAHARAVRFAEYLQWGADEQLGDAARRARAAGLALGFYRDLAVGAAPDGAEAWSMQRALARDVSIGAPPDPFAREGQLWHLPPLRPDALAADGYAAFRALLRANMRHAGALRIDHVMGLARQFWIPAGAPAAAGAYVRYPLHDLLGALALESVRARCLVVGEDLGTVPDGLRTVLEAARVLSYRLLWFEREGAAFLPPARYPALAAACVSTHDLPTVAGWWNGVDLAEAHALRRTAEAGFEEARAAREVDKVALVAALAEAGVAPDIDPQRPHAPAVTQAVHAFIGQSNAALALVQADDLADEPTALNLPGTDRERPNWRRKVGVPAAQLWDTPNGRHAAATFAPSRGRQDSDSHD